MVVVVVYIFLLSEDCNALSQLLDAFHLMINLILKLLRFVHPEAELPIFGCRNNVVFNDGQETLDLVKVQLGLGLCMRRPWRLLSLLEDYYTDSGGRTSRGVLTASASRIKLCRYFIVSYF